MELGAIGVLYAEQDRAMSQAKTDSQDSTVQFVLRSGQHLLGSYISMEHAKRVLMTGTSKQASKQAANSGCSRSCRSCQVIRRTSCWGSARSVSLQRKFLSRD